MKLFLIIATIFVSKTIADKCTECIEQGKHFCATVNSCGFTPCITTIKKALNCPEFATEKADYDEDYVRNKIMVTTAAAFTHNPQTCFNNQMPTMKVFKVLDVNCSRLGPESNCFGYTAYDTTQRAIVIAFRGTEGAAQFEQEIASFAYSKKAFFNAGNLYSYFYNAFLSLWNGGLQNDIRQLKYNYPDYELWVNGHSLGGSLASIAASYIVQIGLYKPENIKLVTMGQPRTGDYEYAVWHDITFPYSHRIVHHKDMVPHIPPQLGNDPLFHHRTEIWYNNNMTVGSTYHVCKEADGLYCSNTQLDPIWNDHDYYYAIPILDWGYGGCKEHY